jgi:hypothetical protein
MKPRTFNDYEREVVATLLDGHLSGAVVESILAEAVLVSFEDTGAGYFLTAAHPDLPVERIACHEPVLIGTAGDLECGFVIFIENGELTLECHTWLGRGLPADFRSRDVRIERAV